MKFTVDVHINDIPDDVCNSILNGVDCCSLESDGEIFVSSRDFDCWNGVKFNLIDALKDELDMTSTDTKTCIGLCNSLDAVFVKCREMILSQMQVLLDKR